MVKTEQVALQAAMAGRLQFGYIESHAGKKSGKSTATCDKELIFIGRLLVVQAQYPVVGKSNRFAPQFI
ncbi:hypothetical protein D9M69_673000 [compost metagenome]